MEKIAVSWHDVEGQCHSIIRDMHIDVWRPDYVIGITRGGLVPANLISQYLACPMRTLHVSLRDGGECESRPDMVEDAVTGRRILIVDDINDSGATIDWIRRDWQLLEPDAVWDTIWHQNLRLAVLIQNEGSECSMSPDYIGQRIDKRLDPRWISFPWEKWWY